MTKSDELWLKFQGRGVVTYKELKKLMSAHGFIEYTGYGNSRIFENKDGLQFGIHEPHPGKDLKTYQKNGAQKFIEKYLEKK